MRTIINWKQNEVMALLAIGRQIFYAQMTPIVLKNVWGAKNTANDKLN